MTRPRLDPLALPPATTGRFLLLIATAVAAAVQVNAWLANRLPTVSGAPGVCVVSARRVVGTVLPEALIGWYSRCTVWAAEREAAFVGLMLAVFAVVTIGIYLAVPLVARRGLRPLAGLAGVEGYGEVVRRIEELVRGRRIDVYVSMIPGRSLDRTFGRLGRYAIVLDIRRLQAASDEAGRRELDGVVRHELAHVHNRDVDLTYLAIAVWWGFLVAVALPFAVVAVRAPSALWDLSWRLVILLGLLWVLRCGVFRTREFYADVQATSEPAWVDGLVRAVRATASTRKWLAFHPAAEQREAVIDNGERLFRLDAGVAAAVGALVGLAYPPAEYLASLVLPDHSALPGEICGIAFALLVAGVLGGNSWRAALLAAVGENRQVRALPAALAFAAALTVARLMTPELPGSGSFWMVARAAPGITTVIGLLLVALVWAYLRWSIFCAACWLPVAGRPRLAYRFGVLQSALVFGIWLAAWFQIGDLLVGNGANWSALIVVIASAAVNPLLIVSIPWACGYPLATWQTRRMADRATKHGWWRHEPGRPSLPGLRTPLASVIVTALGVILAYGVVVIPFYPQLRAALNTVMDDLEPTAAELLSVVVILGIPALAVSAAGLFAQGILIGGRHRLERAVTAGGSAVLPAAVGVMVLMLAHIGIASPRARGLLELLGGLSGHHFGGAAPAGSPANAALGLMVLALFTGMLLVGLPAAVLGSLVRSLWPARPARRPIRRPPALAAALALPLLLVAYLAVTEWRLPRTVTVPQAVDMSRVEQVFAQPWPTRASLDQACGGVVGDLADLHFSAQAGGGLDVVLATSAASARSAADTTLQAFGEASIESLRRSQIRLAEQGVAAALRYCAAAEAMS